MSSEEKSDVNRDQYWNVGNPVLWGIACTIGTLSCYWYLAAQETCGNGPCISNFERFLASPPNEIGDTLAGIAGILAFLWIIITVLLQSRELAAQRKELELTRDQFTKMAEAQDEQVKLLVKQGEIFKDEQIQRTEEKNDRILVSLESLIGKRYRPVADIYWYITGEMDEFGNVQGRRLIELPRQLEHFETLTHLFSSELAIGLRSLKWEIDNGFYSMKPTKPKELFQLKQMIEKMTSILPNISEAQRLRIELLPLTETRDLLDELWEGNEFWAQ